MARLLAIFFVIISIIQLSAQTIYDIQYTTNAGDGTYPSPLEDEEITVTGIVCGANFQSSKFFMCDLPEDGIGEWHGIYVYNPDPAQAPQFGDIVEVSGTVVEYYGLTELSYVTITILSSNNPVPDPIIISAGDLEDSDDAEMYEGCLVKIENATVTEEQNEYGEWYVDDGTGECQMDDGFFYLDEVDPPIEVLEGDTWVSLTGCVDYSYDQYAIHPRTVDDMVEEITENPSIVGSFQDWDPADTDFSLIVNENGVHELTQTLDIGSWEYKVVEGDTWDAPNYPTNNQIIELTESSEITWKVNLTDDLVTHTNPIIAGNFISEIGGNDWDPADFIGEMVDDNDDDIFTWSALIPVGYWECKVTLNHNWDQNTGPNVSVISDGIVETTISYNMANNETTTSGQAPDTAAITFLVDDSEGQNHTDFFIKGTWDPATGSFDPNWGNGAETVLYDDGTNGDATANDHVFSITLDLVVDGGSNTWEWGVVDENHNWIDGNWQFQIIDSSDQTLTYEVPPYFEVPIYDIQYTEEAGDGTYPSVYVDQNVKITGIVTGTGFGSSKFFVCDLPEIGTGAWHGIYVYNTDPALTPQLGDKVEVMATVTEYYGFTELGYATINVLSSENEIPDPIIISTGDLADSESGEMYESCLVEVHDITITETQNDYGEWYMDDSTGNCQGDDGFFYLDSVDPPIEINLNDQWQMIRGCVDYSYDAFAIHPRFPEDMVQDNPNLYPPQQLEGTVNGDDVTLTWLAPEETKNDRELLGYKIYRGGQLIDDTTELMYIDYDLSNGTYEYWVSAQYDNGESEPAGPVEVIVNNTENNEQNINYITSIGEIYPNPFNPETSIQFSLSETENVCIEIYNMKGQKIKTLVNEVVGVGNHSVTWDGKNDVDQIVSSGIYFSTMRTGKYTSTKKLILMK